MTYVNIVKNSVISKNFHRLLLCNYRLLIYIQLK